MAEQKVLVTGNEYASEVQEKVDELLSQGWKITSVTAQHVATANTSYMRGGYFIIFTRK